MRDINFFLPDFYSNFRLIMFFQELIEQAPQRFFDQIKIKAAYGCFPGSIWNGGRVMLGSSTKQEMAYVIEELNARGIAVRYTYTNPMLEEIHLLDTYCNLTMELGDNGKNEVLVNTPIVEQFIRANYPSYTILSSTTKCLKTKESVEEELKKDYSLVVLDSAFNNTEELFAFEGKDKIELLVNHYCRDNCPDREAHYRAVGSCQLDFSEVDFKECPNIKRDFYQIMKNRSFISTEELYTKYYEAGFCNFKLDGRAFGRYKVLESFVYFMVKPEYRDEIRLTVLKKIDQLCN